MNLIDLFKPKRKTGALLFRDDRVISQFNCPVEDRYMVDKDGQRAWGLHSSMLYPYKEKLHHIIIEHDCGPIGLNGERWEPELNLIIGEQYNKKLMKMKKESMRTKAHNLILMLALILSIPIVILALASLIKSGALKFPSMGIPGIGG